MAPRDLESLSREELLRALRASRDAEAAQRYELAALTAEVEHRQATWSRHARLYDDAPIAFLMLDRQAIVRVANRAAAELLAYDQAEMIGKPFIVVARMRDAEPFWRHVQRCFEERAALSAEIELEPRPNETKLVQMTSNPLPDPLLGGVLATALVDLGGRLVAERDARRAHEEERRVRARLKAQARAVAAIGEAHSEMHVHGVDSVLQAISEQARHLVDAEACALGIGGGPDQPFDYWMESGVSRAIYQAIGRPPRRVGVLDRVASGSIVRTSDVTHHPSFRGLPDGHFPIGSFLGIPVRHREHSVGSLYVANKRTAAEFDEDDERALVLLGEYAALVIEAALATEVEVRERARLRTIIDQLPEAVLVLDAQANLIPNRKALELSHPTGRADPFGHPMDWDVRFPDGRPAQVDELPLVRAFQHRESLVDVELALATRDGRLVPVLVNATPLLDEQGRVLGAVAVWRDIEQLRQLEQLRQEWAAVVAHDLKQPLSIIRMWDRMLTRVKGKEDEKVTRAVTAIDKAVTRMGEMLEDLIDTSLVETHRVKLQKRLLRLEVLVDEVVSSLSPEKPRVKLSIEPSLPLVEADRGRIERVLENLLSNAFKYGTPGAEVALEIAERQGEVEVAVSNTGRALSPEEMRKLFERFYRAPSAGRERGLGLGLYIAQGFVEAHGGRLWCDCGGERTTFRFTLPCCRPVLPEEQHQPMA